MLKQFKIIILAPTCFGSRRNHHQGAVLCLDKNYDFFYARRYRRGQFYGGISACCASMRYTAEEGLPLGHNIDHVINDEHNRIIIVVLAKHEIAP